LREAYLGHHKFFIVDNTTSGFEEKMKKGIGLISSVIGLPTDRRIFRKYLVAGEVGELPEDVKTEKMKILETYLNVPADELADRKKQNITVCVRQRSKQGATVYNYEKRYMVGHERIQEMRQITAKDYIDLLKNKSDYRAPLLKERTCFVFQT